MHPQNENEHPHYCRYCGNQDTMTYCSRCGAELIIDLPTPLKYFADRLSFLLQPAANFVCAFLFLLFRPVKFFDMLEKDGATVNVLYMFTSHREPVPF